jgi:hypothetical protein
MHGDMQGLRAVRPEPGPMHGESLEIRPPAAAARVISSCRDTWTGACQLAPSCPRGSGPVPRQSACPFLPSRTPVGTLRRWAFATAAGPLHTAALNTPHGPAAPSSQSEGVTRTGAGGGLAGLICCVRNAARPLLPLHPHRYPGPAAGSAAGRISMQRCRCLAAARVISCCRDTWTGTCQPLASSCPRDRGLRRGNPCVRPCRVGRRLAARLHLPRHSFKTWMGWNSGPPAPTWKQCMVDKFRVSKEVLRKWYRRRPVAIAAGPTQPLRPSHRSMIEHSRWAGGPELPVRGRDSDWSRWQFDPSQKYRSTIRCIARLRFKVQLCSTAYSTGRCYSFQAL